MGKDNLDRIYLFYLMQSFTAIARFRVNEFE